MYIDTCMLDAEQCAFIFGFSNSTNKEEFMFYPVICTCKANYWQKLKEKLPQAFMQIGWMEDDFRNLTAKVWAILDNPIKRYDFFERFH